METSNQPIWQSTKVQWIGFLLGWVMISIATLTPMDELPPVPGTDKLHHILGFAGWSFLCVFGSRKRFFWMALFIFFWGGAIEMIQPYVNRHREFADFVADGVGVLCVLLPAILITRQRS